MIQTEQSVPTTFAEVTFNPSAVINIFSANLNNEVTRKVLKIKGVYNVGNGINYKGLYYDVLKDNTSNTFMSLLVPESIRHRLSPGELIECSIYLTKKIQFAGGRIELQLNLVEVFSQEVQVISEADTKTFTILQKKAELGYKDVDSFIKSKIIQGETISVCVIIGKAGIIDSDIKHQLQEAIGFYKINFVRVNLAAEKQIIDALNHFHKHCDILAISRGGGENLDIFNDLAIAETALQLPGYFITALGHKDNIPLLQKVADKAFITPTALGQYFNDIYNRTKEEMVHSKAKLIDDLTLQFDAQYKKQIEHLKEKNDLLQTINEREMAERTQSNVALQLLQKKHRQRTIVLVMLIILGLIAGWLLASYLG